MWQTVSFIYRKCPKLVFWLVEVAVVSVLSYIVPQLLQNKRIEFYFEYLLYFILVLIVSLFVWFLIGSYRSVKYLLNETHSLKNGNGERAVLRSYTMEQLSDEERQILSCYLKQRRKTIKLLKTAPIENMIKNGILIQPKTTILNEEVNITIEDWAWDYINKNSKKFLNLA